MKRNILVSGSHRSGSTWTGRVIARAGKTRYVHEPFNVGIKDRITPFSYWFEYLNGAPPRHQKRVKYYLNSFCSVFHIQNLKMMSRAKSANELAGLLMDLKCRVTDRTIIKDPIAIMSAEWIYENCGWDVVILIRHPAAFVASLKVKEWQFDFNQFLQQELLMKDYLSKYATLIREYSINKKGIIN